MNRQEVLTKIRNAGIYYLTTVDAGNRPKARPYGFLMDFGGRLCFTTNENKPTYTQLMNNPYVELVAMVGQAGWLRISGKAVKITSPESCRQALAEMPMLAQNYAIYGGQFDVFAMDDAVADYYTFGSNGEIVKQSEKLN